MGKALVCAAKRRVDEFTLQNLASTAWAFFTTSQCDEQFFMVSTMAAGCRVDEFIPQDFANTAWAFTTANFYSKRVFCPSSSQNYESMNRSTCEPKLLHQCVFWHRELNLPLALSLELRDRYL